MKQTFYKMIALLILTGSVSIGWIWMDFKGFMNSAASIPDSGINIEVGNGATIASVSQKLYDNGILSSNIYPRLAAKIYPELTLLQRGEYHLKQKMTPFDIFKKLVSGKVISYQIRFIEGWTFKKFLTKLAADPILIQKVPDYQNQQLLDYLQIPYANLEGWLYPDTYNFHKGTSDLQILKMSHELMQQKLDKYWDERDTGLPFDDPYQILILASIIEKETGISGERDRIAGVFIRRLNKNMRLQTDPTVIYGLGDKFDGNIKKTDLLANNPYNTYLHKGLPPTPIAMPSEASLKAAVHPAEGTELYFVARGDGTHQFSSTLEQHNQAVQHFQLKKNN